MASESKRLLDLVTQAANQGFRVKETKRGFQVINPETREKVTVYPTSTSPRTYSNTLTRMISMGFIDPNARPSKKDDKQSAPDGQHGGGTGAAHHPPSRDVVQDPTGGTPMAPAQAETDEMSPTDRAIQMIESDLPYNAQCIATRVRELAVEQGGQAGPSRRNYGMDGRAPEPGVTWRGELKEVLTHLFPELKEADREQLVQLSSSLLQPLKEAGLCCIGLSNNSGSTWWVRDEEPRNDLPDERDLAEPQHDEERPLPPAAAAPVQHQDDGLHHCEKCCYAVDKASSLRTHNQRSGEEHMQDEGAPHRCQDIIGPMSQGRITCRQIYPTAESLVNHVKRDHFQDPAHKPFLPFDEVQFCKRPVCATRYMPKGRAHITEHNLTEHNLNINRKGSKAIAPPAPQAPPAAKESAAPPPLRRRDRVAPEPDPAAAEAVLVPTVPQPLPAAPAADGVAKMSGASVMDPEVAAAAVRAMVEQYQAATVEVASSKSALSAARGQVAELRKVLDGQRVTIANLESKVKRLEANTGASSEDLEAARAEVTRLTAENAALKDKVEAAARMKATMAEFMGMIQSS